MVIDKRIGRFDPRIRGSRWWPLAGSWTEAVTLAVNGIGAFLLIGLSDTYKTAGSAAITPVLGV